MLKRLHQSVIVTLMTLVTSLTSTASLPAKATEKPAIDAFFQNSEIQKPTLSPDGKTLAMLIPKKSSGYLQLAVLDLATMAPHIVANFSNADVASYSWVNNQRTLRIPKRCWMRLRMPSMPMRVCTW